jgi:hypothetical protein
MNAIVFIALSAAIVPALLGLVLIGLAIFGLRHAHPKTFWLLSWLVAMAWLADVLLNQALHLALWDVRGITITQRLKHYLRTDAGWRTALAIYLRAPINALDAGHL